MDTRITRLMFSLFLLGCAGLAAVVWHQHGKAGLRRLTEGARAELRDALNDERKVIHHYVYETWPTWWGYPYYAWWEERRTVVYPTYYYPPQQQPQPAPARQVQVGPRDLDVQTPQPTVNVQTPSLAPRAAERREQPAPEQRRPMTPIGRRLRPPL